MIDTKSITDNTLYRLIHESADVNWSFFALKVMITRLKLKLKMSEPNNEEEVLQHCYADIRNLFNKSANIPNAQKDLQIIVERFGKETK